MSARGDRRGRRRSCAEPKPEDARFDFTWLSATGTGILLAAVAVGALAAACGRGAFVALLAADPLPHALAAGHDRRHAGPRLHHALQRHGRDARPGVHAHRRGCIRSSRRCSAGSAWR